MNKIDIEISKITEVQGMMSHHLYLIEGKDKIGTFSRPRRFKQIQALRAKLVQTWIGFFIPSVPQKKLSKKLQRTVVKRIAYFNHFLQSLAALPFIFYSDMVQDLLRSEQEDLTSTFKAVKKEHYSKYILNYKSIFPQILQSNYQDKQSEQIQNYKKTLQENIPFLAALKTKIKQPAFVRENLNNLHQQLFLNFNQTLDLLMLEQPQKPQETKSKELVYEKRIENPLMCWYLMVKSLLIDSQSLLTVFSLNQYYRQRIKTYQQKISKNERQIQNVKKQMAKTGSTKSNNIDKLQKQNQTLRSKVTNKNELIDIILKLQSRIVLPLFQKMVRERYMRAGLSFSKDNSQELVRFWENALESQHIKQ